MAVQLSGNAGHEGVDVGNINEKSSTVPILQRLQSIRGGPSFHTVPLQDTSEEASAVLGVGALGTARSADVAVTDVVDVGKSSRKRVFGRYAVDWILWIVLVVATAAVDTIPPRATYIPYDDLPRYSFPLKHADTVPTWAVPLYSVVGPYAVMAPLTVIRHRHATGSLSIPYNSLGGELSRLATALLTAEFATGLTTNAVKLMVGRPRPNFAARCWPDGEIRWKTTHPPTLDPILKGGVPNCTGQVPVYREGMKSFPSGHTSWSAAGLSFFSWWLRDYLKPIKAGKTGHAWHAVAAYWPMFGAVLVGVSRYTDYMHHWQDILVGYLLGTGISWIVYHVRWPYLRQGDLLPHTSKPAK